MRRLITALASLAVVSLLIPSIGLAIEAPAENGVGILCIFTSEDLAVADNVIPVVNAFQTYRLYFLLYNEQIGSNTLGAMTWSWRLDPVPTSLPLLQISFPPNTLNLGDNFNIILGFGSGVATTDNHALVATVDMTFLQAPAANTVIFLGPADPTSIPGKMEYNDFTNPDNILPADPNSVDGSYDNPVFGLNMTIATETETWGGVKSLFR